MFSYINFWFLCPLSFELMHGIFLTYFKYIDHHFLAWIGYINQMTGDLPKHSFRYRKYTTLKQILQFFSMILTYSSPCNQIFFEFWLVHAWFFAQPRDHRTVITRLENVSQLNIKRFKKLGFQLLHRLNLLEKQPPEAFYVKRCS